MSSQAEEERRSPGRVARLSRAQLIRILLEEIRPGWIIPRDRKVSQFKARVQELGRISIPEAEREVMGLRKGDIVQVVLWRVKGAEGAHENE